MKNAITKGRRFPVPFHNGQAILEIYRNVYGDWVLLTGAYVDYNFDYPIKNEKILTVDKRDEILASAEKRSWR